MKFSGALSRLPKEGKILIFCFLITLSFGFYTGLIYVQENTNASVSGIEEHYLGNENNEDAIEMKFKKPKKEIITMVHNHVLSLSIVFAIISFMVLFADLQPILKKILVVEPFVSLLLTFGGIWVMWSGVLWFKYIIILSGIMMVLVYTISTIVILKSLFK